MDVFSWTVHGRTHLTNNPVNWIDPWGLSPVDGQQGQPKMSGEQVLDSLQLALGIAGAIPGIGEVADLVNAGISLARGNYVDAALSVVSVVPIVGDAIGKGGKAARFIEKSSGRTAGGSGQKSIKSSKSRETKPQQPSISKSVNNKGNGSITQERKYKNLLVVVVKKRLQIFPVGQKESVLLKEKAVKILRED